MLPKILTGNLVSELRGESGLKAGITVAGGTQQ